MSTDINADSSEDNGEYYSHWLRRKVRKPTPVLYNMIQEIRYYDETKKVKEEIQEYENLPIRKKLRSYDKIYKDKEVLEDQIFERCKTHPDDVNWIDPYHKVSPFNLFDLKRCDSMMLKAHDAIIKSDSFRVFDEL